MSCAADATADTTIRLADRPELFVFTDPDNRSDYGQAACPDHYVLELEREPDGGNVSVGAGWSPLAPTSPCTYRVDSALHGFDGESWTLLGKATIRGKAESGVCGLDLVSSCGKGKDPDAPVLNATDAKYTRLRATIGVLDGAGNRVPVMATVQRWR